MALNRLLDLYRYATGIDPIKAKPIARPPSPWWAQRFTRAERFEHPIITIHLPKP